MKLKRLGILGLVSLSLLGLVGCGTKEETKTSNNTVTESKTKWTRETLKKEFEEYMEKAIAIVYEVADELTQKEFQMNHLEATESISDPGKEEELDRIYSEAVKEMEKRLSKEIARLKEGATALGLDFENLMSELNIDENQTDSKEEVSSKEESVIVDNDKFSITYTGITTEYGSIKAKLTIVNKSDKSITIQSDETSVDGVMAYAMMSITVAAGKTAHDGMLFSKDEATVNLKNIEGIFNVLDTDTFNRIQDIEFKINR